MLHDSADHDLFKSRPWIIYSQSSSLEIEIGQPNLLTRWKGESDYNFFKLVNIFWINNAICISFSIQHVETNPGEEVNCNICRTLVSANFANTILFFFCSMFTVSWIGQIEVIK